MSRAIVRASAPSPLSKHTGRSLADRGRPFFGALDCVLVDSPVDFTFDGALPRDDATAIWTWMVRDIASDLIDPNGSDPFPDDPATVETLVTELLARAGAALAEAGGGETAERRLKTQLGGEDRLIFLPIVLTALKCRQLLKKAEAFGRAANGIGDEASLALALQSMPLQDHGVAALLMHAAVGQMASPSRLVTAAIRNVGSPSEAALARAGFGPMIDAMLAHAQDQVPIVSQAGAFADFDIVCRAVDRFHRLIRAVNYVETSRVGRWAMVIAALTKTISERIEPRLRDVAPDVNKALRRVRDGTDRLDADQILSALNGVYLLATVRDCRDSLALNAVFDHVWTQIGQALEIHIERNLELLRQDPSDRITLARMDAAIKMSGLRFNAEYAEVLRRAKDAAIRRTSP